MTVAAAACADPSGVSQATKITLHKASRALEVAFDDGATFRLPLEYLRTHSPSAEVQGHGRGHKRLVPGKREVGIHAIEPVGNYGVLLRFDDGHDTGIFSWDTLHELGDRQDANWQAYLAELQEAGLSREPM